MVIILPIIWPKHAKTPKGWPYPWGRNRLGPPRRVNYLHYPETKGLKKTFDCLVCDGQKTIHVQLLKKQGIGKLRCSSCRTAFEMAIHYQCEEVDVFYAWVDATEAAENNKGGTKGTIQQTGTKSSNKVVSPGPTSANTTLWNSQIIVDLTGDFDSDEYQLTTKAGSKKRKSTTDQASSSKKSKSTTDRPPSPSSPLQALFRAVIPRRKARTQPPGPK